MWDGVNGGKRATVGTLETDGEGRDEGAICGDRLCGLLDDAARSTTDGAPDVVLGDHSESLLASRACSRVSGPWLRIMMKRGVSGKTSWMTGKEIEASFARQMLPAASIAAQTGPMSRWRRSKVSSLAPQEMVNEVIFMRGMGGCKTNDSALWAKPSGQSRNRTVSRSAVIASEALPMKRDSHSSLLARGEATSSSPVSTVLA